MINKKIAKSISKSDDNFSQRFINLDPNGYFLIKVERSSSDLIVEHYSNDIDKKGIAIDPETGKPLSCDSDTSRIPIKIYRGKSAKDVGIQLTEGKEPLPISKLDHALYIGRELQKAEFCMINEVPYRQD